MARSAWRMKKCHSIPALILQLGDRVFMGPTDYRKLRSEFIPVSVITPAQTFCGNQVFVDPLLDAKRYYTYPARAAAARDLHRLGCTHARKVTHGNR